MYPTFFLLKQLKISDDGGSHFVHVAVKKNTNKSVNKLVTVTIPL